MHVSYDSAEAFLATPRPCFASVVLDVQLGGMSGIELGRLLAKTQVPVIYVTAHDDPETRASAESAGCAGFFRKSDSGADLLEVIRTLTA
jgi:FixJ family two-component response regulator